MLEALRGLKEENGEAEWKKVLDGVNKGNFIQVVLDSYEALFLGIIDDTFSDYRTVNMKRLKVLITSAQKSLKNY